MIKTIKYIILTLVVCSWCSCNKFLDVEPVGQPILNTFWSTENDANTGLAGCYAELRNALNAPGGGAYFWWGETAAGYFNWSSNGYIKDQTYNYMGDNGLMDWSPFYKVINLSNLIIDKVSNIPLSKFSGGDAKATINRNNIIGQAYFLRAFTYFYMARIWGEVPLVLQAATTADEAQAQKDLKQVSEDLILQQCLRDLEAAKQLTQWGYSNSQDIAIKANKGAVCALMAHVYMWQTKPSTSKGGEDKLYTKAEQLCDSVIKLGGYQLVDSTSHNEIFKGQSSEGIFEICYSTKYNEGVSQDGWVHEFICKPILPSGRDDLWYKFSSSFFDIYEAKDNRKKKFFYNFGSSETCQLIKYTNIEFKNTDKTNWVASNNFIVMRLADIMLLRAEALSKLGRSAEARDLVTPIRARAGLDPLTSDFVGSKLDDKILNERRCELCLEGGSMFDLIRTGAYKNISPYNASRYMEQGYLFPVQFNLLMKNPSLRQTPYWADKMIN